MTDTEQQPISAQTGGGDGGESQVETTRQRFNRMVRERAGEITSVRNDVYTTTWWQIVLNFIIGAGAVALLIASMCIKGTASTVCMLIGVACIIVVVVYNVALRTVKPMSFLQYTYIDRETGKRYCFQVLSKNRSAFSDGEHFIEVDRGEAVMLTELSCGRYKFDFFADMDVDMRIGKVDSEVYTGTYEYNGKQYKAKIVFKGNVPLYGSIGGGRIKYFDVNNVKEKFVVPSELKRAVKGFGINFPKVPGLYVRDDIKDAMKQ